MEEEKQIDITLVRYDNNLRIGYEADEGSFRIETEDRPHPDLTKALADLVLIFITRMQLESVSERIHVTGLESGKDDVGKWYRISGVYTANLVAHKLVCPKLRYPGSEFWEDIEDPSQYPGKLTDQENESIEGCIAEARAFVVDGKRAQLRLDIDGGTDGKSDADGEDVVDPLRGWEDQL